jgi:hypothetical protein
MTEPRLPPRERAKRYLELAREARVRAANSKGGAHAAFVKLAGQWNQFALEAEAEAKDESGN